jgi:hypothetical protein
MADYFLRVGKPGTATTLSSPGYTTGDTSITVGSTANWPTTTKVAFAIDRAEIIAGEEVQIAGTYTEWTGQVTGATTIGSMVLSSDSPNSDQNYSAGSLTRVYIPVSATRENKLVEGILQHANQDGTLITQAVRDALSLGTGSATGWEVGSLPNVSTVTDNGNNSYTLNFASAVDTILSEGMRARTTRNSAAGVTCFSLDGSNDYLNKTSPAGMTFTDNFTVSAWVYLTSYPAASIIASRYNGTSGWQFFIGASGQIQLSAFNAGSGNYSYVSSYQSVPLNKWVHVAAQLDMSTFTATTTTSYTMINGKDVPASVGRAGTNPTALIQAGNLEIGGTNGGTLPFPGYIKDVAIYNSKVTQATISASRNQPLTGSEANLISAYSGANTTDLNTTNANNLTAQNGAVTGFASAPWGNRGVSSTTLDYGLVMAVSGSTATVQVPEGCTIPTTGGVSAVAYSVMASPFGFVSDKGRWAIVSIGKTDMTTASASFVSSNWQITAPVGSWAISMNTLVGCADTAANTDVGLEAALSTSATAVTNSRLHIQFYENTASAANHTLVNRIHVNDDITASTQTTYYAILKIVGATTARYYGNQAEGVLKLTPSNL